jgi:threonine dehydrogenase-like Zn-dependent dehydrogenase
LLVRAAVQVADRAVDLRTIELADEVEPGWAILQIEASGICGSDHEIYSGAFASIGRISYPLVAGHEPVGRIEKIGDVATQRWRVGQGDLVAVEPFCPCGACSHCVAGRYHLCASRFLYGHESADLAPGIWGGFADHMLLRPGSLVHKIPDGVSAAEAVLFNPLGAGFEWAYRAAQTQIGDTVLILGPGQRGLASVIAAREAGAARIIVTGRSADVHRLSVARELGATDTVDVDCDDTVARVTAITHGDLADRVIDVTPYATQPVADAVRTVRPGGTIVLAGVKARAVQDFDIDTLHLRAITVRGVLGVRSWSYRQAIQTIAARRYPLHLLQTHAVSLDEIGYGIELLGGEVPGEHVVHVTVVP